MIRIVESPGLGLLRIHDEPRPPLLAPWLPEFHVEEVQLLKGCRSCTLRDWQTVVTAKAVFPGAVVTNVVDLAKQKKAWDRRMKRTQRWGGAPPAPDELPDE